MFPNRKKLFIIFHNIIILYNSIHNKNIRVIKSIIFALYFLLNKCTLVRDFFPTSYPNLKAAYTENYFKEKVLQHHGTLMVALPFSCTMVKKNHSSKKKKYNHHGWCQMCGCALTGAAWCVWRGRQRAERVV